MSTDAWNPQQYHQFRDERSQPFRDLAAMVQLPPGARVVDLGCGTGVVARQMAATSHPSSEIHGADVSDGPDVPRWTPNPAFGGTSFRGKGLLKSIDGMAPVEQVSQRISAILEAV